MSSEVATMVGKIFLVVVLLLENKGALYKSTEKLAVFTRIASSGMHPDLSENSGRSE